MAWSWRRFLIFVVLGPVFGMVTAFFAVGLTSAVQNGNADGLGDLARLIASPPALGFAYAIGVAPAVVSGVLMMFFKGLVSGMGPRLAAGLVIGALVTPAVLNVAGVLGLAPELGGGNGWLVALSGGVAGLVCAGLGELVTRPRPSAKSRWSA